MCDSAGSAINVFHRVPSVVSNGAVGRVSKNPVLLVAQNCSTRNVQSVDADVPPLSMRSSYEGLEFVRDVGIDYLRVFGTYDLRTVEGQDASRRHGSCKLTPMQKRTKNGSK